MSEPLLTIRNVSKSFGAIQALTDVRFDLERGEVHALVGENGAGKSTLMNILGGVLQPDSGEIALKGAPYRVTGPARAQARGIGLVHQEIALCPDISVAENIFMAETSARGRLWMETRSLRVRAEAALADLHPVPVGVLAGDLPIASQQIVEIAKALTLNCDILIFDEPTAALTETEAEALFAIIRGLKARGIGIIYISHRMAEIFALSDRVTVFRDGTYVETLATAGTSPEAVATRMVGRPLLDLYPPRRAASSAAPCLTVASLADGGLVRDVSLGIRPGEILGLGGLIGSGRTETAVAICGLSERLGGEIRLDGMALAQADYPASIRAGVVYLSEDRKGDERLSRPLRRRRTSRRWICGRSRDASCCARAARPPSPRRCATGSASAAPACTSRWARSAAATSRRWRWRSCWPCSRGFSSSTSPPAASTSVRRPRSTPSCATSPMRASPSW